MLHWMKKEDNFIVSSSHYYFLQTFFFFLCFCPTNNNVGLVRQQESWNIDFFSYFCVAMNLELVQLTFNCSSNNSGDNPAISPFNTNHLCLWILNHSSLLLIRWCNNLWLDMKARFMDQNSLCSLPGKIGSSFPFQLQEKKCQLRKQFFIRF